MPWSLRMVLYAAIILCVILLWFGFRYFRSVKLANLKPLWLFRSFFLAASALFLAYPATGLFDFWQSGSFSRTEYPNVVIYLFWYGLVYAGVMLNWIILHDLFLPVAKRISSKTGDEIKHFFAKSFLVMVLFTMIYTASKMAWDTNRIITEEINYTIPDASVLFEPLTIVHIADLHADEYTREAKMDRYIQHVNSLEPDIVLFAGDLVTSGTGHIQAGASALGNIESKYGVFAVLGDHDYWTDTEFLIGELQQNNVHVLLNENVWVDRDGFSIKISGVTKIYSSRIPADALSDLLNESSDEQLKLMVSHQATDFLIEQSKDAGVHQLLAGHTHGGQIRIPLFFYYATASRTETRFVNGHWMLENMLLNINNGLGFTLVPVRYNAPPQISVIRVLPESDH